ncbi:MAG: thioredoxin domain-containing protein [Candidatus Sumerlaeota bacterium]|nr:thioredoxin domain-containing protein [Candidatus Sumerlaeota bacterium]
MHPSVAAEIRKQPPLPSAEELRQLPRDGGPHWNRLVFEKSPYLLQHAGNPVDWRPWGEEAFETARREDKPVFLSIGYSTCHWCHVMERESFEDGQVAALLNQSFVCVKVDREERPDVDAAYMSVCQALTGGGGWPLTIFLTPDKEPFFAGTYFPKRRWGGQAGLMELLPAIAKAWKENRSPLLQSAGDITQAMRQAVEQAGADRHVSEGTLETAFLRLQRAYDARHGGFGVLTKFPTPHNLSFLLRYAKRYDDAKAREMAETTLRQMRMGGVYDQVGFGFHRYSTSPNWLVPHFEKMLYDQALLAITYVEAFQATGNKDYARTAREVFTYVLRDMASPEGAFYSAEDADSEGEEGKFYLWTKGEIEAVLGKDDSDLFCRVYGVSQEGSFVDQATKRLSERSILHCEKPIAESAREISEDEGALRRRLDDARAKLFEARETRIHPHKDDKILTDWNGLMIAALARGAMALDELQYAEAARRAADFILSRMRDGNGRLLKRYREGEAGLTGLLEDYAFLTWGLLDLYEATFDSRYLKEALALTDTAIAHFWDGANGGFFLSPDDGEPLPFRTKEIYDGATPSGNSAMALNLLRLARITGNTDYEAKAQAVMRVFAGQIASQPSAHCQLMCALDFAVGPSAEIVIAGRDGADDTQRMLAALRHAFVPNKIALFRPDEETDPPIASLAPWLKNHESLNGAATAYVCRNHACHTPTTDVETMLREMAETKNRKRE